MQHELDMIVRGAAVRGTVYNLDDTGGAQLVDAETHAGVARAQVEVLHPYGFCASAPAGYSYTVLLAMGADQGDMLALPPAAPSLRFGNLAPGEVAVYDSAGNRLHIKAGGNIDLLAAALLHLMGQSVTIDAPAGVTINGPLTVNGGIAATQDVVAGQGGHAVSVLNHQHTETQPGTGESGPPA